jgi:hypothetical protein
MGEISCLETLVTNHQFTLRNIPEERNLIYIVAESWNHAGWQNFDNPNSIFRCPLKQNMNFLSFITNYFIFYVFSTNICNSTLEIYTAINVVCLWHSFIHSLCRFSSGHSLYSLSFRQPLQVVIRTQPLRFVFQTASAGCHPDTASAARLSDNLCRLSSGHSLCGSSCRSIHHNSNYCVGPYFLRYTCSKHKVYLC